MSAIFDPADIEYLPQDIFEIITRESDQGLLWVYIYSEACSYCTGPYRDHNDTLEKVNRLQRRISLTRRLIGREPCVVSSFWQTEKRRGST